ncbi:phosphate regulon sensor histidine kinase PhoR [Balneatrix alpica]|uniref:Phosphate regulon sensor protein PhoR n=1 Tax=Balneatrix alpica TaxID=75684 RepID=A0ABV5ZAN8_9GAMM|nr:phosphate regulon sensor histidine kinase PhoR [Balneatrix alpica]
MRTHLNRLLLLLVGGLLLGGLSGSALIGMVSALLLALGWHLWQLRKLVAWLASNTRGDMPEGEGLWGEIFDDLYRLQKQQADERQRLQVIISRIQESTSALRDGVVLLDAQGNLEWWNPACANLLGLKYPQDRGHPLTNLVRQPEFVRYFNARQYHEPLDIPSPLGRGRYLQFNITLFGKGDRLLLVHDVTRLQHLERMRQDFVANASHELRTPLTVISGYLETLSDHLDQLPRPWVRPLQQMTVQAKRMQTLITDLLTLSRLETTQVDAPSEAINLEKMLQAIRQDALALGADKQQRIELEVEPGLQLLGREPELHSAFSNLAFNAVKYTPAGGHIRLRWYRLGEQGVLEVQDNGPGIEAEHLPRLTERFYRVDSSRSAESGGTGLGLAIVKHVLLRHQAELSIDSVPGQGSIFRCKFPPGLLQQNPGAAL